MKENDLTGKKVYIKTKSGRIYSGTVKEISNNIIKIYDKFNQLVYISEDELAFMEEREG